MDEVYCKVGGFEFEKCEAFNIYENGRYVVTSAGIYQPHYSNAQQMVYFRKITEIRGLVSRGSYHTMTAEEINNLLGFKYLMVF